MFSIAYINWKAMGGIQINLFDIILIIKKELN